MTVDLAVRAKRCGLALLLLYPLSGTGAVIVPEDDEAAQIRASIARLEGDGADSDATLAAARTLLALSEDRRARIDEHVARAAEVESIVAGLERDTATLRASLRATGGLPAADAGTAGPSTIALRDQRDGLDIRLARLREQLATLDRLGPAILRTLESDRETPRVLDEETDQRGGSTVPGANVATELLETARRHERDSAVESLRRELGTVAPRTRIATARLHLLELRRDAIDVRLQERVANEDAALLAAAGTRIAPLEAQLEQEGDAAITTARPDLALALGYARLIEDLARHGDALRAGEKALQRARRDLLDAETGARAAFASGTLSDAQGTLLVRLRREMPDPGELEVSLAATRADADRLRVRRVLWEDELRRLEIRDTAPEVGAALRHLVEASRGRGDRLERQALLLGDTLEGAVVLGTLLDRRLLWLRRSEPLGRSLPRDVLAGVRWLTDPAPWTQALATFTGAVMDKPYRPAAGLLLAIGLLALRRRLLSVQESLAERVGHVGLDTYWVTPRAIALAVLLALPVPLAIAATGWPLAGSASGFPASLGLALVAAASLTFTLGLFRRLSRTGGVFITHFGWSETAAQDLARSLRRLGRVQVPMTFLLTLTLAGPETRYGLGLLAFTAISLALGGFAWRVCRPRTGVLALAVPGRRSTYSTRLGAMVLVAAPVAVGLLPLAGYLDAAITLQARVLNSGLILLSGAVVYGLLMRIYAVSLRRYSLRWTRERRAERARSRDAAQAGEILPIAAGSELLAPEPLAGQARVALLALATVAVALGLWGLWAPLLPALGIIDEIVLWERSSVVDGTALTTAVTLWSLLLAVSLFVGGLLAARNLRGLLQVGLLQRLDFDAGTRYAIVTIAGYVALGAGLVGGLAQLGIDWSKLQWIVAALGVGLGFGLQEIVANFVSGLIILFERPVRVGDVVTIGNLSGTVSDIRIRATTVTDFENREVLLPNKAIITENVTNWTLRDATTRLLLTIGVAYGSDVGQVRTLLTDIVQAHPDVLAAPAPSVFFVAHGPSSLDFELRVFVASTAERLPTTHDLNASINARLGAAGIAIPFPQTDVTVHLPVGTDRSLFDKGEPEEEERRAA